MSNDHAHIPEYDEQINLDTLNIFSPSDRWRPLTIATQPPPTTTSIAKSNNDNNLYCTACKKKFSNEATFQGHLKSAKHIANEKKNNKPKKTGSNMNAAAARQQKQPQDDPAVKEGCNQLKQAIAIANSSNPVPAVGVLWNLSKNFYTLKRPRSTFKALHQLVKTLETIQPNNGLTPSQIQSTLYASRLALARLSCLYPTNLSTDLYLNALQDKWKLDRHQLISLAQQCDTMPLNWLLAECKKLASRYIDREEKREAPAPVKTDKNQSFMTILNEAIGVFEVDTILYIDDCSLDRIKILLLCLASIVAKYELGFQGVTYMEKVALMYEKRAKLHQASQARVILYNMSGDDHSTWHLFLALLIALEIDDFVRVDKILQMIDHDNKQDGSHEYLDMQVLVSLSKALKVGDYTTLKHTIPHQLEHLGLLLDQQEDKLLLLRRFIDPVKRDEIFTRLQMLMC